MTGVNAIVSHIKVKYSPMAILLGGSRATNSHHVTSDWDIYLIGRYHK